MLALRRRQLPQLRRTCFRRLFLEGCLGFADATQPGIAALKLLGQIVAVRVASVLLVFVSVGLVCAKQQRLDLGGQALVVFFHPPVAHGLVLAGIGLHFGPIERDVAHGAKAGACAQLEHLHKQARERIAMLEPKLIDRREVRMLAAGEHPKGHVLVGGTLDLAR